MTSVTPSDLVERERELAELSVELDASLSGDGRVLVIEGPAGVGKTRLLMEARSQAADRGARALIGRASQLEREFPFGVVRQLFEAELAEPELRERALSGAAAPAQAVFSALPDPGQGDGVDASFAILHGLYWMTLNIAQEQPLVLAIDDLQWSDRPSLRFLAYLARRIEGLPVLAASTVRTGEPPTDESLMGDIGQDPATMYIRPAPLTQAGVAALVTERLGSAENAFAAACHGTTGGNPLLVRQLLTALEGEHVEPTAQNARVVREIGPRAVSRSVLLRLARMPSQTIAVARAVAVLGESAELPTVAALAELPDTQAAAAIATLARAEILRPEAPLGFVHPLVRDAVYPELPPGEREMQHARAARILHEAGAQADQVATHLMAVPRHADAWASEVLVEAGRSALRRGATENAVAYFTRALEEPPPDELRPLVLFELGLVSALTNALDAIPHLQAAYDEAPNAQMKAMSAYALSRCLLFAQTPTAGINFARRARQEIDAEEFVDVHRSLQALDAIGHWFGVSDDQTLTELERFRGGESAGEGPGARMLDAMVAYDLFQSAGPVDECIRLARRALADQVLIEYDNGLFNIPALIVLTYSDAEDTIHQWDIVQADAYRRGSMFGKSATDGWRGFTLLHLGELVEADQLLEAAYAGLVAYGYAESVYHYFVAFHSRTILNRGDAVRARQVLERVQDTGDAADGPRYWVRSNIELLLAENKVEQALEATFDLEQRFPPRMTNPACWPYRSLRARALCRLDRRDEAVALVEEELELVRQYGAPGIVGRTLKTLGQMKGDHEGVDDLAEACEVLEGSHAALERAEALAAYGGALRRTRQPTDAREPLRRALELAEKCGATVLAEQTRSELYATGARPRTDAVSGIAALTASERRVADLAAEGNSNRDIAQALFVTPKTVEVHLSNAYRKLGIRSRRDLPAVLVG